MPKFKVVIREVLSTEEIVEASSAAEAEELVRDAYYEGTIVVDGELDKVEFETRNCVDEILKLEPVGNEDWFYFKHGDDFYDAVYFNPDSNEGGQYVKMCYPFVLVLKADAECVDTQDFFAYLEAHSYDTRLIDITDYDHFEACVHWYRTYKPTAVGRTDETRSLIVASAKEAARKRGML